MIIPVDFGQVTATFSGSGVPTGAAITYGFANGSLSSAATIASTMRGLIQTHLMPPLIQNTGLAKVLVKLGPNEDGPSAEVSSTTAGGDVSAQAPPNVAYLVQKSTLLGGRRNRGRFFLPGVDETEVDQTGLVSAGKLASLETAVDNFFDALVTADLPMFLLHNDEVDENGDPIPGTAPAPTAVTSLNVSSIVATQRRRLRR